MSGAYLLGRGVIPRLVLCSSTGNAATYPVPIQSPQKTNCVKHFCYYIIQNYQIIIGEVSANVPEE